MQTYDGKNQITVDKLSYSRSTGMLTIRATSNAHMDYAAYCRAKHELLEAVDCPGNVILHMPIGNLSEIRAFCLGYLQQELPAACLPMKKAAWYQAADVCMIVTEDAFALQVLSNLDVSAHLSALLEGCGGPTLQIVSQAPEQYDAVLEAEEINEGKAEQEEQKPIPVKAAPEKPKPAAKKQPKDNKLPVLLGKPFAVKNADSISSITFEMGSVTIVGKPLDAEMVETKRQGRYYLKFAVTDYYGTVAVRTYADEKDARKFIKHCEDGGFVAVKGQLSYDQRSHELVVNTNDIGAVEPTVREDKAEVKRVELHAHTKMSSMDGFADAKQLVKTAARMGHEAVAVTDHGVVQAFPDAYGAIGKSGVKLIYGLEAYFADDSAYYGPDGPIEDIVAFDIETTGLDKQNDCLIEIGAVRLVNGEIVGEFNTFVDPGRPISQKSVEITGITDEMVAGAPDMEQALREFKTFAGDSVLCAHNSRFDMSFIRNIGERYGIFFQNGEIDTLALARMVLPNLGRHTLDTLAKHYQIPMGAHHRACDDAKTAARLLVHLMAECKPEKLSDLNGLRQLRALPVRHIIILAKSKAGLRNLYRLVTASHLTYMLRKKPVVPKSLLAELREDLIVGSACEQGEIFRAILEKQDAHHLEELASFYDYLEIQPIGNNAFLLREDREAEWVQTEEDLRELNREIVRLAERVGKPVAATCDVHFIEPHDEYFRRIILAGQGFKDADEQAPLFYRTTEEMLEEFAYLGEDKAREVVIDVPRAIAATVESGYGPYPDEKFAPKEENADELVVSISYEGAHRVYGETLPDIVKQRLDKELHSLVKHEFTTLYLLAYKLVKKSVGDGYSVGSRGSVGSSFVAFAMGISEVNPLAPHYHCPNCKHYDFDAQSGIVGPDLPDRVCPVCGTMMDKDGYEIPFEVFLGFEGDKVPDIDLNFSGEYQKHAFKYVEEMFGENNVFRAGTVSSIAEKNAYGYVKKYLEEHNIMATQAEVDRLCRGIDGVKKTTGQHPGGLVILPEGLDMMDFTPLQRPADKTDVDVVTTHFDFNSLHDRLVKLDILGHDNPTIMRYLWDVTGIDPTTVPVNDPATLSLFTSCAALGLDEETFGQKTGVLGLPEFGTSFVMGMLEETKPTTISELIRISGLSHGTDVWLNNAQDLIREGIASLNQCICTRDDIMNALMQMGVAPRMSFDIMERVRKGKGLTDEMEGAMRAQNVPEWFIDSCKKIKYMFPKAHAAAYVVSALRIGYFKVHDPLAFYSSYFTVRGEELEAEKVSHGLDYAKQQLKILHSKQGMTARDQKEAAHLAIACEMMQRGYTFLPVDINISSVKTYTIEDGALRIPLMGVSGMGESAAESIALAREDGPFHTVDDVRTRAKVNSSVVEKLRNLGTFEGMQETAQMSLF